jgi:transposase
MATHYIGADVDCNTTVLAVRCGRKVVAEYRVPTSIPALSAALDRIPGPKHLTIEEGSMADWLYRNLHGRVREMIVCDPRRNRLIVGDGDKTNAIDAKKLAELLQGGNVRAVYPTRRRSGWSSSSGWGCITTG